MSFYGSFENEDLRPSYENEDPLQKRRPIKKTETLQKQVQKRLVLPL